MLVALLLVQGESSSGGDQDRGQCTGRAQAEAGYLSGWTPRLAAPVPLPGLQVSLRMLPPIISTARPHSNTASLHREEAECHRPCSPRGL